LQNKMDFQRSGTNLHSWILSQHGREVLKMLRLMEKTTEKLARWKNNKHFNLRCVRCNVVPKCLHLKPPIKGTSAKNLIQKTERRLLNIAIAQCQYTIRKLEDIKQETLENLRSQVSSETMDAILKHVTSVHERVCHCKRSPMSEIYGHQIKSH
jgi:hypothetical protein